MSDDTERVTVTTYVPAYQRDEWRDRADDLDMSLSEFVRSMTQAGRQKFDVPVATEQPEIEPSSPGADPGGDGLESRVLEAIKTGDHPTWDDLVEALAGDFEARLDETLGDLQQDGRVQYSGRHGGYTVVDDE